MVFADEIAIRAATLVHDAGNPAESTRAAALWAMQNAGVQ
jgi:hypothetical protein